jgi:hypothetical protein
MVFINHELKLIYLHNVKCGGCYMRNILCKYYGFTGMNLSLHNKYSDFFENPNDIKLNEDFDKHTIRKMGKYRYMYSHQDLNQDIFDNYFIFIFVRNPYDKLYSAYLYLKRCLHEFNYTKIHNTSENMDYFIDFNTFVKNYQNVNNISYYHAFIKQYEHLTDYSGNIKIQYIGSFENLDNELVNILNILNIKEILHIDELFYSKHQNVTNKCNYDIMNDFNEDTFNFINNYFEIDFEVFGYKRYESFTVFKNTHNNKNNNYTLPIAQLYKDTNIIIYNNLLQEKLLLKYENITNQLLEGIESCYSNSNIQNEIKTLKLEIQNLHKEKDEIVIKNKYMNTNVTDIVFDLHKNIHTQLICKNCQFVAFNKLAYCAHTYFCK